MRLGALVFALAFPIVTAAAADPIDGLPTFSETLITTQQTDAGGQTAVAATDIAPSLTGSIFDVDDAPFAFPNWIVLQDHEGDSFTVVWTEADQGEAAFPSADDRQALNDSSLIRVLVDDEGVPLFSASAD